MSVFDGKASASCDIAVRVHRLASANGPNRLALLAGYQSRIGASQALELQVFADGVIEQSHAPAHHTAPATSSLLSASRRGASLATRVAITPLHLQSPA